MSMYILTPYVVVFEEFGDGETGMEEAIAVFALCCRGEVGGRWVKVLLLCLRYLT